MYSEAWRYLCKFLSTTDKRINQSEGHIAHLYKNKHAGFLKNKKLKQQKSAKSTDEELNHYLN